MEKLNYYEEFYYNEIMDPDEMLEHKEQIEYATKIEKYLSSISNDKETIRSVILCSFRFHHVMEYEERLNHIRGIIYASHYISSDDLRLYSCTNNNEISTAEFMEKKARDKSLFEVRTYSNPYDYEFFRYYMDNASSKTVVEDITDDYLNGNINNYGEVMVESEDMDEDMSIEEFFGNSMKSKNLSPEERIRFFKNNFSLYKEGVFDNKNIKKGTSEYEFVSKGMDDYYNYIMRCFEIVDSYKRDNDNKSRSLFLTI